MDKEFTFVSITYNHQAFIEEHLESIKEIIKRYGNNIKCNLIISDDCSKDMTNEIASNWIRLNRSLFYDVEYIISKNNKGVVGNFIQAIEKINTPCFKVLAGDDKYLIHDIFSFSFSHINSWVYTKVAPLNQVNIMNKIFSENFYFAKYICDINKVNSTMKIMNFLLAPGVFYPLSWIQNEKFYSFLSQYKLIEDYPMWRYFLSQGKRLECIDETFVLYRTGSGVSNSQKSNAFEIENKKMIKDFDVKFYKYPKYINPYRYWNKYQHYLANKIYKKELENI